MPVRDEDIEAVLAADPAGVYPQMDAATRADYSAQVGILAQRSGKDAATVARALLAFAAASMPEQPAHVGDWLLGRHADVFARHLGLRRAPGWRGWPASLRLAAYAAAVVLGSAGLAACAVAAVPGLRGGPAVVAWLLVLLPASHAATALVQLAAQWVKPRRLPRLQADAGIPAEATTLVVVPALLGGRERVDRLVATLRRHHARNRGPHVLFAVLTDFADAASEHSADDAGQLDYARSQIAALNADLDAAFLLLHRPRRFDHGEGVWMGEERKRGKLMDLARLLVEGEAGAFLCIDGARERLRDVRYVMTLDFDNELPAGSLAELVAIARHPLNRPAPADGSARPRQGYGILQPQPVFAAPGAHGTWHEHLAYVELPPGCNADLYQDLFDEGSFHGKGLLHIEAFHHLLHDAFPRRQILSHDIVEGCLARSGLAADVHVPERLPRTLLAELERWHRWIRGDWQSLPLLSGRRRRRLTALSRWKILDNMRRTTLEAAMVPALLGAWIAAPAPAAATLALLALWWTPAMLGAGRHLATSLCLPRARRGAVIRAGLQTIGLSAIVQLCLVPQRAFVALDAIARALWRTAVSHRLRLQWRASDTATDYVDAGLGLYLARMLPATTFALVVLAALAWWRAAALSAALPVLAAWLLAPGVACVLGQVPQPRAKAQAETSP